MVILLIGLLFSVAVFGISIYILETFSGRAAFERTRFSERIQSLNPHQRKTQFIEKIHQYSEIKALNKLLQKQEFSRKLKHMAEVAGWRLSISIFILISVLCACALYFVLAINNIPPSIAVLLSILALIFVPIFILRIKYSQYLDKFGNHFPKALQVIRGALGAGLGLGSSFERVAEDCPYPVNAEFTHILDELKVGTSLTDALINLYRRVPTLDVRTFVVAISVQQESGGNLIELTRNLEETITARMMLRKEMGSLTAQARLSGWILFLLPFGVAGVILLLNHDYIAILTDTPEGRKLLMLTGFLQLMGLLTIKKITTVKLMT